MTVAMAMVSAGAVTAHEAGALAVEHLLLLGTERRVEGLGGVHALVHFGIALGAQGTHAVDALGRAQALDLGAIGTLVRRGLERRGPGAPGAFLGRGDGELLLQLAQALG